MSSRHNVRAFTWRELIVVIALIGLLLVVFLPSANSPRGASRRSVCQNNMRQLALAAYSFDASRRYLPGYRDVVTTPDGKRLSRPLIYMMMPQLERNDLYEAYNAENHPHDGVPDISLSFLVCHSAGAADGPRAKAACSFIFNTGMPDEPSADAPPDWPANGIFHDAYLCAVQGHKVPYVSVDYISQHDGATNTLLFSERAEFGRWNDMAEHEVGFVWHPQLEPGASRQGQAQAVSFDAAKYGPAKPSSNHPGVFNVAFCDGHVRTIDQNIDYRVYAQLMTPWGAAAAYPGLREGKKVAVDEGFRTQELPNDLK